MQIRIIYALIGATICLFGCASTLNDDDTIRRTQFIENFAAKYREEACGTHWVGNPSFADCMSALRREAESQYQLPMGRDGLRGSGGPSSKP
jgi:hypothetical protein